MRWKQCKDGIEIRHGSRSVTLMSLQGDGFMWKLADWGIEKTEPEAIKQAEAAFDMPSIVDADSVRLVEAAKEIKQLRALLSESLAIHRDSLESNKMSDDEPDCECKACKRFRSIIARIEAVLR